MYLEGSDQHRGWFQSSLLLSLAGNGAAPYKSVLTHGFMVDADREKISKSKQGQGVYEKPQTSEAYIKKWGADIVRLWVSSQDFRNDVIVSEERITKVAETYRAIRNALRYQLSNLYDFDPAKHTVVDDELTGLDRWILSEFSKLEAEVIKAYDAYEFHVVYQIVSQFIAVELSAIYHDVIKDRLYTDPANSPRRRSTQTALHRLVASLCQMLAPILSFTADEAWEFVPGKNVNSVHEANWVPKGFVFQKGEQISWGVLLGLRQLALPELEKARKAKDIGKALEAKVAFTGASAALIGSNIDSNIIVGALRELINVSQLEIKGVVGLTDQVSVTKADGQKCERCWHWETDVGSNPEHPTMCGRCVEAVFQSKRNDEPETHLTLVKGRFYHWQEIGQLVGHEPCGYLTQVDQKIVCGCFRKDLNPDAPGIVLPGGDDPQWVAKARLFQRQGTTIPIFVKAEGLQWEFVGHFRVKTMTQNPSEIQIHRERHHLDDIGAVMFLCEG